MSITRVLFASFLLFPITAAVAQQNDLRQFRVGMPASALPEQGYAAFSCADQPSRKLSAWHDYQSCPARPDGSHAVSFRYDDEGSPSASNEGGKTQVAGQPVNLALLINDNAMVTGIRIETDPNTRLYMHKKAFLFALQVRARFGQDGWTCSQLPPTPTEQPVGGVFVHEHCEKTAPSRLYVLDRQLFHDPAKDLRDLTDASQLTIKREG